MSEFELPQFENNDEITPEILEKAIEAESDGGFFDINLNPEQKEQLKDAIKEALEG